MTSIRRKRRQRGKHKELRREAQKTFDALQRPAVDSDEAEWNDLQKIVLPMIRRIMPATIAEELVSVQPMSQPWGDAANGVEPAFKFNYRQSNKAKADERKRNRIAKKKNKKRDTEASGEDSTREGQGLGQAEGS